MSLRNQRTGLSGGDLAEVLMSLAIFRITSGVPVSSLLEEIREREFSDDLLLEKNEKKLVFRRAGCTALHAYFQHENEAQPIARGVGSSCRNILEVIPDLALSREVHHNPARKGKDDVRVVWAERSLAVSLKLNHDYVAKYQSVDTLAQNLYSLGFRLRDLEDELLHSKLLWKKPALRFSSKNGDYSDELKELTDKMLKSIWVMFQKISDDPARYIDSQSIDLDQPVFGDKNEQLLFVKIPEPVRLFKRRPPVAVQRISLELSQSKSGRSRKAILMGDGRKLVELSLKASCDEADPSSHDLRIPKPQLSVKVFREET